MRGLSGPGKHRCVWVGEGEGMCVSVCGWVRRCLGVWVGICMQVCACACACVRVRVCVCVCVWVWSAWYGCGCVGGDV